MKLVLDLLCRNLTDWLLIGLCLVVVFGVDVVLYDGYMSIVYYSPSV